MEIMKNWKDSELFLANICVWNFFFKFYLNECKYKWSKPDERDDEHTYSGCPSSLSFFSISILVLLENRLAIFFSLFFFILFIFLLLFCCCCCFYFFASYSIIINIIISSDKKTRFLLNWNFLFLFSFLLFFEFPFFTLRTCSVVLFLSSDAYILYDSSVRDEMRCNLGCFRFISLIFWSFFFYRDRESK